MKYDYLWVLTFILLNSLCTEEINTIHKRSILVADPLYLVVRYNRHV